MNSKRMRRNSPSLLLEMLEDRKLFSGGALIPGGIVDGTIQQVGQQDSWTFEGHTGDTVRIGMTSTPLVNGYRSYAELYQPGVLPGGPTIKEFYAIGAREVTLESDGVYTLVVHDSDDRQTGKYAVSLEGVNPISPEPTPLVIGGITAGTIDKALDVKQFTFDVPENATVTLGMTSTAVTTGFRAYAELFAPGSGTSKKEFFARGQQSITLTEAGSYMLLVHDSGYDAKGTFTIGVEGINPISPAPVPLVMGGIVGGNIEAALDVKQFVFNVPADATITLGMTSTLQTKGFRAYAELFAPGSAVAEKTFFARGQQTIELTEPGIYMLMVHDSGYTDRGSFTIGLEGINPISPAPVKLKSGGIAKGDIKQALEVDQFTFEGKADQSIQLLTTTTKKDSGYRAYYSVYSPTGSPLGSFFAGTSPRKFDLKEDGTYLVYVRDSGNSVRGSYTIGLEGLNPVSTDAKTLTNGVARSGTIGSAIGVDQYLITLKKNDRISLTLTSTAVTKGFSAKADIFGADGSSKAMSIAGTKTFVAPANGTYMIQVHDSTYSRNGKYTIVAKRLAK